jgi:hypothetical protein
MAEEPGWRDLQRGSKRFEYRGGGINPIRFNFFYDARQKLRLGCQGLD